MGQGTEVDNHVPLPGVNRLGRYELLAPIASGGMATVFLGRATGAAGFERLFAIKCCHPHLNNQREFANMFLDEARIAARIHHPNVVATVDVGEAEVIYLVMDYVRGGTLRELMKAAKCSPNRALDPAIVLRILTDALAGLHAAHLLEDGKGQPLGLVHRDVTPHNVLVGADGVSRITDFGIAKASARLSETQSGVLKGKLGYMPPEQLGPGPIDHRADVFAAGVVLWEALIGKRLFMGETPTDTLRLVLTSYVPPPSQLRPDIPPALDAIVAKAVAVDPDKRYPSALAFLEALEESGCAIASPRLVGAHVTEVLGAEIDRHVTSAESVVSGKTPPPKIESGPLEIPVDVVEAGDADTEATTRVTPPFLLALKKPAVGIGLALVILVSVAIAWRGAQNPEPSPSDSAAVSSPASVAHPPAAASAPASTSAPSDEFVPGPEPRSTSATDAQEPALPAVNPTVPAGETTATAPSEAAPRDTASRRDKTRRRRNRRPRRTVKSSGVYRPAGI